jgi:hypothetical protein
MPEAGAGRSAPVASAPETTHANAVLASWGKSQREML